MSVRPLLRALLDLIYPDSLYCICCGRIIDDSRTYKLCNDCISDIPWINGRYCICCGKRLAANNPSDECFFCREHRHSFDKGYSCIEYGEHARSIVFALKYHERADFAPSIAEIMFDRMSAEFPDSLSDMYNLLVPVPMYAPKQRMRGYNQAELICREFAGLSGIDYHGEVLERLRETRALKNLSPERRREELHGVMGIRDAQRELVRNARVLLIDDIYTTGATMDEAAEVLKAGGAAAVDILSFASGADVVK